MKLTTVTARGPAYWASYLVNGDPSAMTDEEIAQADRFAAYLGAAPCDVGEQYFDVAYVPTLGWFTGDVAEYSALVGAQ